MPADHRAGIEAGKVGGLPQCHALFGLLVRGMRPEEISAKVGLNYFTLRSRHTEAIRTAFGTSKRSDLCLLALGAGYITAADLIITETAGGTPAPV